MTQAHAQVPGIHIDARATGGTAFVRDAMGPTMGYVAWDITFPCDGLAICTPSGDTANEPPASRTEEEAYPDTREMPAMTPDAAPHEPRRISASAPPDRIRDADAAAPHDGRTKRQVRQVLRNRTNQLLEARPKRRGSGGYGGGDQLDHHTNRSTRKGERQ